jgi:hypothetical protein
MEYLLPKEQILFASGPSVSFKVEMRKLLDSTMANYQQLLDMLTRCPSLADSKVKDRDIDKLFHYARSYMHMRKQGATSSVYDMMLSKMCYRLLLKLFMCGTCSDDR